MKKTLLLLLSLCALNSLFAQWNYVSGSSGPIYYNTGNVGVNTNNPGFTLDVFGTMHAGYGLITDDPIANGISAWIRGGSNIGGNLVVQGDVAPGTAWPAWWISGGSGYLKIGSNGGSEPSVSPINIDLSGHVGINTQNTTGYTFNVNGTAVFDAVTVKSFSGNNPKGTPWADYVFDKDYQLPTLESLKVYIRQNGHLPGIPTAAEVEKNGFDLGATQAKLLEKIEQLTLYTIDLQKQADEYRDENKKLTQLVETQNQRFAALQQQIDELKKSNSKN
jgi:hypothetical protein